MGNAWKLSKKLLKSVSGLCLLMLFTAVVVTSLGTLLSGGIEQWQAVLKTGTSYFLIGRLIIYSIMAGFWYSTISIYKQKNNQEALERIKRLGYLGLFLIICTEGSKWVGMFQ